MKIKDLKEKHPRIYERALECQVEQGNERNDEVELRINDVEGNFDWLKTGEGVFVWDNVNNYMLDSWYEFWDEKKEENTSKQVSKAFDQWGDFKGRLNYYKTRKLGDVIYFLEPFGDDKIQKEFFKIYKGVIQEIVIDKNGVEYWTDKSEDAPVKEKDVNEGYEELFELLKIKWELC